VVLRNAVARLAALVFLASLNLGPAPAFADSGEALSVYMYDDTKRLVSLVEDAADLMQRQGETAFAEFAENGSRWFTDELYLFVYHIDGTCAFHAANPSLIGKNLMYLRDMNGKPVIRFITDIGLQPAEDASGWVFYFWEEQTQLNPAWKTAYIRKVVAPDGKTFLVGSGRYQIKVEKRFVELQVKAAAKLLTTAGKVEAFKAFQDPASPFVFLDTFIFVLDKEGRTLIDPAYPTLGGRNLSQFKDMIGARPLQDALAKLAHTDHAWVQYLWPQPGRAVPTRKLIYLRKVEIDGETLIIGTDFFLATPIWLKVEDSGAEDSKEWRQNQPG